MSAAALLGGAAFLLAAVASPVPAQGASASLRAVDARIASAHAHLRAARFEVAMSEAETGLASLGRPRSAATRQRAARLHVVLATAELAFGREDDARRRLDDALRIQPDLVLDDDTAPPKLRRALETARLAHTPAPSRVATKPAARRPQPRRRASPRPPPAAVSAPPPPAQRFVPLAEARAALSRSLLAVAGEGDPARLERWEIRPAAPGAAWVWVEIARRRIDGRLHVLEHVRVDGDPEAEVRLLSIESASGGGRDRILFRPASGRARRLGPEAVALLPRSLALALEELEPPRLEDFELISAHGEELDGEPVWVIEARSPAAPGEARVELVLAESDGQLLMRRWFRPRATQPFRTARVPRAGAEAAPGRGWRLSDRERGVELEIRLAQRIEHPALDPGVFTLARLRGASPPIPIPESR